MGIVTLTHHFVLPFELKFQSSREPARCSDRQVLVGHPRERVAVEDKETLGENLSDRGGGVVNAGWHHDVLLGAELILAC